MFGSGNDDFEDEEALVDPHYRPPPPVEAPQAYPVAVNPNTPSDASPLFPPPAASSSSSASVPMFDGLTINSSSGGAAAFSADKFSSSGQSPSPPSSHSPQLPTKANARIPTSWGGFATAPPASAAPVPAKPSPSSSASLFDGLTINQPTSSQPAGPLASTLAKAVFSGAHTAPAPTAAPFAAAAAALPTRNGGHAPIPDYVKLPMPVNTVVTPATKGPGIFSSGESEFDDEEG